jgi:hypothetical protein
VDVVIDSTLINRALLVWLGWHSTGVPRTDDAAVTALLGADLSARVVPILRELKADFWETDAAHTVWDLAGAADKAAADFTAKHPDVSAEAVKRMANEWAYGNR